MVKLLIIDGLNLLWRVHSAVPGDKGSEQHAQDVVRSASASVARALKQHQPTHAVCVLESPSTITWRHQLYAAYKQERKLRMTAIFSNLPPIMHALQAQQVAQVMIEAIELGDAIASISDKFTGTANQCLILSTDHLLAQLLNNNIRQYDHFLRKHLDPPFIQQRYKVDVAHLVDYFALCGSGSLNIPGLKGVGNKMATRLVNRYGKVENLLNNNNLLTDKLINHIQQPSQDVLDLLCLYKRLLTLDRSINLNTNLKFWRIA